MKLQLSSRVATAAVTLALLGSHTAALAVDTPANVSDAGWMTLQQLYSEAQTSVLSSRLKVHAAAATYVTRIRPLVARQRRMTKREMDANRWARLVIRAKTVDERRVASIIEQENAKSVAVMQAEAIPTRERMVKAFEAKLPNQCSTKHTHERAVCLYRLSLAKRSAPAIVAAASSKHAAASKR